MIRRVIVAGGGTGGHLFPGLAVVEELRRRCRDLEVLFVGTERGIENRILPQRGERLELLQVTPLKGQGAGGRAASLLRLPRALTQASRIVKKLQPDLVLGVGGYASGPMVLAAALRGVPTALLEQNASVGMTNRLLAKWVGRAYLAFAETLPVFGEKRARVIGNPVRRDLVELARRAVADPEGFEARTDSLLIIGGSQGARALNQQLPAAIAASQVGAAGLRVVHQTGEAMHAEVQAAYEGLGLSAEVVPFIEDMAAAYARAQLVVCRAGATTVAELCALGRPAILVPFPHAADDHQATNAGALEARGACVRILEAELTPDRLGAEIDGLLSAPARRLAIANAAREHGRPDAAAAIVDDLLEWLDPSGDKLTRAEARGTSSGRAGDGASARRAGLAIPPSLPSHRPPIAAAARRRLVVDGAVWE